MGTWKSHSRTLILTTFIATSLFVGWLIPGFYAWTDSDQSRPSPLLWQVPLWSAIAAVLFSAALPWLPILQSSPPHEQRPRTRFGLRTLLGITATVAVMLAAMTKFPLVVSCVASFIAFAYLVSFCVRNPQHRLSAATLISCMVLPYAWVIAYDELDRLIPAILWMFIGFPAFFPGAVMSSLLGQNFGNSYWPSVLLTAIELGVGMWVIHLGPKRTIAYLLFAMLTSAMGSLVFYQLCIF